MDTLQKIIDELATLVAEKLPPGTMEKDYLDQKIDALANRVDALANSMQKLNCDIEDLQRGALPDFDEMLRNRIKDSYVVRDALGDFIEEQIRNNDDVVKSDDVRDIIEDELGEQRLRSVVSDIIQNDISFEVTVS